MDRLMHLWRQSDGGTTATALLQTGDAMVSRQLSFIDLIVDAGDARLSAS
jgi:hypothetical protein